MPELLLVPSGRILLAAGMVGLQDGSEHKNQMDRFSFCSLFISEDHGQTWQRDIDFQPVVPKGDIIVGDQPGLCQLPGGKIFAVLQAMDRTKKGDQWYGFHTGMSLAGNIIEPVFPAITASSGGEGKADQNNGQHRSHPRDNRRLAHRENIFQHTQRLNVFYIRAMEYLSTRLVTGPCVIFSWRNP